MVPRKPRAVSNGQNPDEPGQPMDIKAALREVLGEAIPLVQSALMDQVEARNAEALVRITRLEKAADEMSQAVLGLGTRLTQQINDAIGRIQSQVTDGMAQVGKSPELQPSGNTVAPQSSPDPKGNAVDKIVGGTERIMTLLNTFVDSAGPKILDMMWKYQAQKSPWLHDLTAVTMLKQADPLRAMIIGQQLVGPNPYETTLPNAMLSGAMWGMRIREAAKGVTWQPSPTTPSPAVPSASSSVAPSLTPPPLLVPPPLSSASMSSEKQVLRLRPVAKAAPATVKPKTLADVLGET